MGLSLLLASATAGCISRCFVHPMDTVRSRLMVAAKNTSLTQTLRDIVRSDGLRGLYRGFGISIAMQAPAVATYLTTYDQAKHTVSTHTPLAPTSAWTHLACGLAAETVSAVFWVPMEVIKQRAQVRIGSLSAATSATIVRDLISREGASGLFKGYGLTIGVFGPYAMIYFVCYERFKMMAAQTTGERADRLGTATVAGCAAGAGAIGGGLTTPLDVIKTRLQTQDDRRIAGRAVYRGTWDAAKTIARQEGLVAFWRGVGARVLWIMPGTAITFATFEFLKATFALD